jgi:nicotinamide-nucleotide amidase
MDTARLKQLLLDQDLTIAVAESLTGGNLAAALTSISGSSAYFKGGVVAYTLKAKVEILGVGEAEAARTNCVSMSVALQMARGVQRLFGADIGVATTGYAEPYSTGDDPAIRPPMAFVAVFVGDRSVVDLVKFETPISRTQVQEHVVEEALDYVRTCLENRGVLPGGLVDGNRA